MNPKIDTFLQNILKEIHTFQQDADLMDARMTQMQEKFKKLAEMVEGAREMVDRQNDRIGAWKHISTQLRYIQDELKDVLEKGW